MNIKRLGVTDVNLWSPNKRDALFFDQIATGSLEKNLSGVTDPAVRADWEFLASNDYVVEYKYDMAGRKGGLILGGQRAAEVDLDDPEDHVEQQVAIAGLALLFASQARGRIPTVADLLALTPRLNIGQSIDRSEVAEKSAQLFKEMHQKLSGNVGMEEGMRFLGPLLKKATARSTAGTLNKLGQYTATPLIPNDLGMEHLLLGRTAVGDVINLVVTSLPEVDELTPWKDVLDFRREEKTREQLDRFGRWVRNAVRRLTAEKITTAELEDEFASMMDSYREHMRVHKMKTQRSAAEIIITSFVGFVEDFTKLRFKAIAESLFKLEHNRVALLEAELKAPGREIAYIVRAHERFG
jgi:hypothetical protein